MADEDKTSGNGEASSVEANASVPKKQRGPRRVKAAPEVEAAPQETAPLVKQRKKRGANVGLDGKAAAIAEKPVKARAKKAPAAVKPAKAVAKAPTSAMEEMAELLHLEAENKRLRQTLAEKLRAENADLRKRLGLA